MPENFQFAILQVLLFWMLTTPHEFAHAWVADRLGDDTPRLQGRVTLNPLAHLDWIGTVFLPIITSLMGGGFFGWGRAVMVNPLRLRGGVRGHFLVAFAGPASNVVFAVLFAVVAGVLVSAGSDLASLLAMTIRLSLYLALFNLLPVPPLDGSAVLPFLKLPEGVVNELYRSGFVVLILLFSLTNLAGVLSNWSWAATRALLALFSPAGTY